MPIKNPQVSVVRRVVITSGVELVRMSVCRFKEYAETCRSDVATANVRKLELAIKVSMFDSDRITTECFWVLKSQIWTVEASVVYSTPTSHTATSGCVEK